MKQLSGTDNLLVEYEKGNVYMHVASLAIYDPSSAPGGRVRFKDILRFISRRIQTEPVFRRRLVSVPLSLDRPYWVEDPDVDVEHHVRHISLPRPGDWRQLCIQVARLHSRPLDRSRPLWELYVIEGLDRIEGLPPGSFAVYTKLHHSAIDGEAGSRLLMSLHAESPEVHDLHSRAAVYADRQPLFVELGARAVINRVRRVAALARYSRLAARRAARFVVDNAGHFSVHRIEDFGRQLLHTAATGFLPKAPATRFNRPISPHRVVEAAAISLLEIKAVRERVPGATLNDVFMTVVGGALRKYLHSKGELPTESLMANVPVTLRSSDKSGDDGNQVGFMIVSLHSGIPDPIARLEAVRDSAQSAKQTSASLGKGLAASVHSLLPPAVLLWLSRQVVTPATNLIVSNVRGPDQAWYLAGARLERFMPISILYDGIGLNVTGFSLSGTLWICAVACRKMMPDPAFFADCLRASFAELRDAAARRTRTAAATVKPKRAQGAPLSQRRTSASASRRSRAAPGR